jgi:hypothetical protein
VLVPAIIAQGEIIGASGSELLTAYVAGYEVWAELLVREPVPLHQKGWHPSAVRGTIAAAAACAQAAPAHAEKCQTHACDRRLDGGRLVANFGSLTKCFQVGRSSTVGRYRGAAGGGRTHRFPDTLEHQSGFLAAFSPGGHADLSRAFDPKPRNGTSRARD